MNAENRKPDRVAEFHRKTSETTISGKINIDGEGIASVTTPIGFFTHMLESFARHGGFDLDLKSEGDMHVDQHHLVEDTGLVLGTLFKKALGERKGIERAGFFIQQMDDAVVMTSVDISGRPFLIFKEKLKRRFTGDFDSDLLPDFFRSFSTAMGCNMCIKVMDGENDHHIIEGAFKSLGRALKYACRRNESDMILSTKGSLVEDI